MQINNINQLTKKISFSSYNKLNPQTNLSTSTAFYLDYPVLEKAAKIINKTFPQGTNIMVYAGSNGEEALSLNTLLKNRSKYKIYSIDPCEEAINYAQKGIYAIHPQMSDAFLINKSINKEQKRLNDIFHRHFIEIPKPKKQIDNVTDAIYCLSWGDSELFPQKYFVPNASINENISYKKDDINKIEEFTFDSKNKKAGAIFFRNAFYQIVKNDLTGIIQYGDKPDLSIDKRKILDNLINNKIYNKLEIGGILVLGNHLQEHLYIADRTVPLQDTILFDKERNLRYMTKHPLIDALSKTGNFKPIYDEIIPGLDKENNCKLPLIWQKIK